MDAARPSVERPRRTWRRREVLLVAGGALLWPAAVRGMVHVRERLFGSPVDLLLPERTGARAVDDVLAGLRRMNARWNAWKPGDVSALNAAFAAGAVARTTPELAALVRGAARLEALSGGCFNAAIGGLVGAWGFHADRLEDGSRPPSSLLQGLVRERPSLADVECRGVELRSRNRRVQLDFGGYAKGVALDWALGRLRHHGIGDALLNLGGNLAAMGEAGARPWRVAVRDPFAAGALATLEVQGREAVVTSGTYERWRLVDGCRCAHIIDPASGRPAPAIAGVTVAHADAALADGAATALLVAGPARWRELARRMAVDHVLVVRSDGAIEGTAPMLARLRAAS